MTGALNRDGVREAGGGRLLQEKKRPGS
jgi:hypothetical protein